MLHLTIRFSYQPHKYSTLLHHEDPYAKWRVSMKDEYLVPRYMWMFMANVTLLDKICIALTKNLLKYS